VVVVRFRLLLVWILEDCAPSDEPFVERNASKSMNLLEKVGAVPNVNSWLGRSGASSPVADHQFASKAYDGFHLQNRWAVPGDLNLRTGFTREQFGYRVNVRISKARRQLCSDHSGGLRPSIAEIPGSAPTRVRRLRLQTIPQCLY
jgi:hypothetical protein